MSSSRGGCTSLCLQERTGSWNLTRHLVRIVTRCFIFSLTSLSNSKYRKWDSIYLCLWVGDGKKPGSRGRYRYGEVRILVLLRTFRLETYLVFSIFQLWEMWVAVAQRWSPAQDSPSEARPRPYAFYLKRHWCENICWPRFPDMILKSITIYEL